MKHLSLRTIFYLFLLSIAPNINSQQTGKVELQGYEFVIPEGWIGQVQGEVYMMGSNSYPGMIIISVNQHLDISSLKQEMQQGLTDGVTYQLTATENIETKTSKMVGATFKGIIGGEQATAYIIGLISDKPEGLNIIATTTNELYNDKYKNWCSDVANSIKYKAPINKTNTEKTSGKPVKLSDNEWTKYYSNTKLTYMESYYSSGMGGGGYENTEVIDLCGSGYFNYKGNFNMSGGGSAGTFIAQDGSKGNGTWNIDPISDSKAKLILQFNNGTVKTYQMTFNEKSETYLDGYRYYKTTAASGAEYAPNCY